MADFAKITTILFLLIFACQTHATETSTASADSKEELVPSESKDGTLEIVKQIKKVNNDGSYTIGYEADDGSFKIESRDILGNVKGTYGYVDDAGEIKRVSYSTSNSSEVLSKPENDPSVVQRIPLKTNRTQILTTRRPTTYSSTTPTPSSTSARLAKLRSDLTRTTTDRPNYSELINIDSRTTNPTTIVYASSTPRVLLQSRSTPASQTQKSEGQLVRPEVVITPRPTELPLFRQLALKHPYVNEKAVPERSNILRRQLAPEKDDNFDPQQHVFTLQQALGADSTDVYSASMTTGSPRPLFTTTVRPRLLSTASSSRPAIRYPTNYQRTVLQDLENEEEYQESGGSTTTEAPSTQASVPIVQIPANRSPQEPLVAIKHPYQRGAILVPLSQIQGRVHPYENVREFGEQNGAPTTPAPAPIYLRRVPPPPHFRPMPVQVDEDGYIQQQEDNNIEAISPPVSTRDFQRLLQQLIERQTRLERISALTKQRREYYQQRRQYYGEQTGPVQFVGEDVLAQQQRQLRRQQQALDRQQEEYYMRNREAYAPARRVARLLQPAEKRQANEEYLPPDVREMLLLRMLQLAINPALPLSEEEAAQPTTTVPQYKKAPVRNVEILGEEDGEKGRMRMGMRNKRFRDAELDYYDD